MANQLKEAFRNLPLLLLRAAGIKLLTKAETQAHLQAYTVAETPGVDVLLSAVPNQADVDTLVFSPTKAQSQRSFVWQYVPKPGKTNQLRYGSLLTGGQVLCTDFPSYHITLNFLPLRKRISAKRTTLIAPWSHHLDGIAFGGYYDFVILVAAKLCRIKETLPASFFEEAAVSYPLFNTAYERDYLNLLGIGPDRTIDSRQQAVTFDACILANSGHWFYPNPADILALKRQVERALSPRKTERKRIYISRAGRRKIANEAALITLLKRYDFTIIDDKPRSVAEQVDIYKSASFIIGPHGASFTNIIWCEPGTHLLELFSPDMVADHFRYLAQLMNMTYSAYHHVIRMNEKHQHQLEDDIFVSIADLEQTLDKMFKPGAPEEKSV